MATIVFYALSTVAALYAVWLLAYHTYKTDYHGKPKERLALPNIVYLLAVGSAACAAR